MKFKRTSFCGERPIFTGSPHIVEGGFNLYKSQKFNVGDVIPAGTFVIYGEVSRLVVVYKTATVKAIDSANKAIVTLDKSNSVPLFVVGDVVGLDTTKKASIVSIENSDSEYKITLSAEITDLAVSDVLCDIFITPSVSADASSGYPNKIGMVATDTEIKEEETEIDVIDDTMQYAAYRNRIPAIPESIMDDDGQIQHNVHIRLTYSN